MTLGERIASHRRALGISQEELGARLGVSRQAVSKWETSTAVPDMENLLALSREFGVSVAELTETPEEGPAVMVRQKRRLTWPYLLLLGLLILFIAAGLGFLIRTAIHEEDGEVSDIPGPATDFALIWTGCEGYETFLELGDQEGPFPFGRELELTESEEVQDTDYHLTTLHRADCGAVTVEYLHTEADPERDQPEGDSITGLSTIAAGVRTPRGIGVGDTRAALTAAYGDDLVYCLKEESGYTLVQHDNYYAYQTAEQPASALLFFLRDGLVAGIRVESTGDLGLDAYAPNNVTRFPVVNGEPDFSQRQEPEREEISDTRRVYIAWNQLVTNDNLSAEELYAYRRDVFSLLPELDWGELRQMGSAEDPDSAIFGLMVWLEDQAPYSSAEILWVQMGCTAAGLDGAYSERYADLLARALFSDTVVFARALATEGVAEETKWHVLLNTAYGADLYPAELNTALNTLDGYRNVFTDEERGWARLLELYLTTPINDRSELPRTPAELG